jgi:class 3 adenylate cyclase
MHRQLKQLLGSAQGESKSVIAINADVRGFSKFSLERESVETGIYVRKVYEAILDEYFPDSSFFKPTGDGLLIIIDVPEGDSDALKAASTKSVDASMRLVEDFPSLLDGDEWIYFSTPKRLGIGIARGTACRLTADDMTLDYSGAVLNTASRLMDIARPRGVVLDEAFPVGLLEDGQKERFTKDENVYIRSLAEDFPRTVYYDSTWTEISPSSRRLPNEIEWQEVRDSRSFTEYKEKAPSFVYALDSRPLDPDRIWIEIYFPSKTPTKKNPSPIEWHIRPPAEVWDYIGEAGKHGVRLNIDDVIKQLEDKKVKGSWPVTTIIRYPT